MVYPASAAAKSLQSCPTLQPHRWQPTRLRCPWDSPGKNTGVGCHLLLQCRKMKSESEVAQSCPTLSDLMDCSPPGSSVHGIFQARVLEWGAIAFSDGALGSSKSPWSPLIYTKVKVYFLPVQFVTSVNSSPGHLSLGDSVTKTVSFIPVISA